MKRIIKINFLYEIEYDFFSSLCIYKYLVIIT